MCLWGKAQRRETQSRQLGRERRHGRWARGEEDEDSRVVTSTTMGARGTGRGECGEDDEGVPWEQNELRACEFKSLGGTCLLLNTNEVCELMQLCLSYWTGGHKNETLNWEGQNSFSR